ncbi:hypothetical protein A2797_01170 [candidate division WWE3 bacterium RIFCSPHIGHO2_01_FULL_48_15]|uniref:Pseudouridine synthase n=1 Tax=candidate division WWE3 bacterium RIFCSPHIGHO2_01_FULL_48_15 TaxID=1802619 RepID=A0A1F4VFE2_UNCKA|nr:MAG: hypothetical protein A2797_01170 [candidate division WWE3 bacterium RIFCSPHIGHO2_01_FULL_48_15]
MIDAIFEDDSLLVLAKPPGQTVNRAETTQNEVTLQDELERYLGISRAAPLRQDFAGRSGIVHRLDKETSGILVVAKTQEAFENLQAQFKERLVDKEYLTLAHGKTPEEGKIEAPLGRHPKFRMRFDVVPGGRESMTEYTREAVYQPKLPDYPITQLPSYSLLRVHPLTGRTHQIRVHLKHIGHPVVSDPLYLSPKTLKEDLTFCPRLFLHAAALSFTHPATNARMRFEAELPDDLQKVLTILQG